MKLYTEEQVRKAIDLAREYYDGFAYTENEIFETLTPIELPSDEEIEDQANKVYNELFDEFYSYTDGAKWMRNKILNMEQERPLMTSNATKEYCPKCHSIEVDAMTPRTKYACGSSDYDKRPNTFTQSEECKKASQIYQNK